MQMAQGVTPNDCVPDPALGDAAIVAHCQFDRDAHCSLIPMGRFIDRSGIVGETSVARCRHCGMGITQPPLPDSAFLYADRTSQDFQPKTGRVASLIKATAFRRGAKNLLASVGPTPSCVIDYGCGSGLFTRCLAESLPASSRVIGIDFHSDPPADLGNREYRSFSDMDDLVGKADLLLAMHVVEHDDDPRSTITNLLRYVRPGGHVVIEVPHIDCVWTPIFGRFWDSWYLPYHRVHFSRSGLRTLISGSGLLILREIDISIPTMGRTAANLLGCRNSLGFILLSALLQPLQWGVERLTGRPTALRVIATKT
jgi:SAM-dependent methyltransferase